MDTSHALAEHLEGADECTIESLLSCVQVCTDSSKTSLEKLEDIEEYVKSSSAGYCCTTVKPLLKLAKPKAAFNYSVNFPPSGVFAFASPPKPTDTLEVKVKRMADSSSSVCASLRSSQKSTGQLEPAKRYIIDSGNIDDQDRGTVDLSPSDIHISKQSLLKQTQHPKPVALFVVDSAPNSSEASPPHKQKKPPIPCMRPQKCDVCQKILCSKAVLKIHLRAHTGEKPYSCSMCPEKFASINYLNIHKRTHTGEKPYSCEVCSRSFSQSANLRRHMLTHTGERPHACSVCEKRFSQRVTLQQHLRTHTGERPFPCSVCPAVFRYREALQRHGVKHKSEGEGKNCEEWDYCSRSVVQRPYESCVGT